MEVGLRDPFTDVKAGSQKNNYRQHFVSPAVAQKVLDACPDAQWRLLFALSRYGGLRCPSEHLMLRWRDVDWEKNRILVHSPKTEHHAGGESRWLPLFPELRPYLLEVFAAAEDGAEFVITRYRQVNANLRTQLHRIIDKAGLDPWPRLFQNLRSTRQTELAERFPAHVVCAWLGNSEDVAKDHYLQLTDAHFEQAVKVAQNAAQQPAAPSRNEEQPAPEPSEISTDFRSLHPLATPCNNNDLQHMGAVGFEPTKA